MPSPAQQKLLQQRDALLAQADALRRTDPAMAKHIEDKAGDMDSELEGVDPVQGRDEQGYLQGDNPDEIAFHAALSRIDGQPSDDPDTKDLSASPMFQAALSKHLGEQMRQNWMKQMQPQGERFQSAGNAPAIFNNSVTPGANALPPSQMLPPVGKSALLQFLLRMGAGGDPNEEGAK